MGDERPTLEDWLDGRVRKKTRAERKADAARRTQVRMHTTQERLTKRTHYNRLLQCRRDLYRKVLGG